MFVQYIQWIIQTKLVELVRTVEYESKQSLIERRRERGAKKQLHKHSFCDTAINFLNLSDQLEGKTQSIADLKHLMYIKLRLNYGNKKLKRLID